MKKLLAVAFGLMFSVSAYGQGTILLQNLGPGLSAPVVYWLGVPAPAGTDYTVDFLVGTDAWSLSPIAGVTRTFSVAGYFGLGAPEVVLPGFAPASHPWFQVRVWNNLGGTINSYEQAQALGILFGASVAFQLAGSGLGNPAPPPVPAGPLFGMSSFEFGRPIPEPATHAILVLGALGLSRRRRR